MYKFKTVKCDNSMNFQALANKFSLLLKGYHQVSNVCNLPSISEKDSISIQEWINRLTQPEFSVAFIGTFNAGKSTIINALTGRLILVDAGKVTTAKTTTLKKLKEGDEFIRIVDKNGNRLVPDASISEITRYTTHFGDKNLLNQVHHVEIYLSGLPLDEDIVLVDTPGVGTTQKDDKEITMEYLKKAHLCVFCFAADNIGTDNQADLTTFLNDTKAIAKDDIFWVINKWFQQNPKQQTENKAAFDDLLRLKNIIPEKLYTISAGTYLAKKLKNTTKNLNDYENKFVENMILLPNPPESDHEFEKFQKEIFEFINIKAKGH